MIKNIKLKIHIHALKYIASLMIRYKDAFTKGVEVWYRETRAQRLDLRNFWTAFNFQKNIISEPFHFPRSLSKWVFKFHESARCTIHSLKLKRRATNQLLKPKIIIWNCSFQENFWLNSFLLVHDKIENLKENKEQGKAISKLRDNAIHVEIVEGL